MRFLRRERKLRAHPLPDRLLFGPGHAGECREVGVGDFEAKSCRRHIADEGGERPPRQGAHEVGGRAEFVGEVLGLVIAVGHADGAVGKRVEHIGAGDLRAALMRHNHRDLLAAAFVEDRRNLLIAANDVLAFVDVAIFRFAAWRRVVGLPPGRVR